MLKNQRKDTYQSPSQSSQKMAVDDPPPQGSPCSQGEPNPCAVPLAKRGNLQERGGRYFTLQVETPMSL
jgi:hypothetical protein